MPYDPMQPTNDRFQPGDLVRQKHARYAPPCLVLARAPGDNQMLVTVHDPEHGIRGVVAWDYSLMAPADDASRQEASDRLAERQTPPLTPWEEYNMLTKGRR